MEFTDIISTSAPILVATILTTLGRVVKISCVPDKYIPLILFFAGGFVYSAMSGWSANNFVMGMAIGGAAVGLNQGYRQIVNNEGGGTPKADGNNSGASIVTPLAMVLSASLLTTGCATTGNPPSQTQVQSTAAVVEAAAQIGVFFAVREEPNTKGYFEVAATIIGIAIADGAYEPATLKKALEDITVNELKEPEALLAITTAISVYEAYFGQTVSQKLDKNVYVKPVLAALKRGIEFGIKLAETYKEPAQVEQ